MQATAIPEQVADKVAPSSTASPVKPAGRTPIRTAAEPFVEQLAKIAPGGVDVGVENVGGAQLEGLIANMREHGRIAWSGGISQYNDPDRPPAAPRNLYDLVHRSIRLEGYLVRNHLDAQRELEEFAVPHLRSGRVVPDDTVAEGIDKVVEAFIGVLRGANTGKMIVQVGDPGE